MSLSFLFLTILFSLVILRKTFFWVWLWQLKEYRLDRVLIHLRETEQGRHLLFSKSSLIKWILIFAFVYVNFAPALVSVYQLLVIFLYSLELLFFLNSFKSNFKRPVFTFKALFIIFLSIFTVVVFFLLPFFEQFIWTLILDKLIPIFISFFIFLFSFPSRIYKDMQIERAMQKIRENKKLLVIGVTGSYGKSSTKEYLVQILSKKFKVVGTEGTNNTPIAIANAILSKIKKDTEIFVAEMGAYKKGEINELCRLTGPKIGVITGINDQHISLFGSIKNTMEAKYELIENLPKKGFAVFNGNSSKAVELFNKTGIKKVLYKVISSTEKTSEKSLLTATKVKTGNDFIEFELYLKGKKFKMKANLIGAHNVENILGAICVANYLGMEGEEIQKAVSSLLPLSKTMTKSISNGITLIDDTFNSNPNSVLAAVNYIRIYKGMKIFVMQPMIELGKNAKADHEKIGEKVGGVCDYLFLTNNNYYKSILKGNDKNTKSCVVRVASVSEIAEFIKKNTKKQDLILFEGKEAANILAKLNDL